MYRLLVLITIAFMLGILAVTVSPLIFVFLLISGLIIYCFFGVTDSPYHPIITLALQIVFFLLGVIRTSLAVSQVQQLPPGLGRQVTFQAQICVEPQRYPGRYLYIVETKEGLYRGKLLVSVASQEELPYRYGDLVEVRGKLELPKRAKNPGEFDYREYLKRQGITGQMNITPADLRLIASRTLNPLMHGAIWAKKRVQKEVNRLLPEAEADLFNSIFFGDKGLLTAEQKDLFSQLGIMHIFAVSGSNVALVLLVLLGLAILLKLKPFGRNALFIVGLVFYAYLTGLTPSVMRATLMALSIVFAEWLRRKPDFYIGLAASALFLLFWNPYNLFDSGFQLSYAVTWGMVYLHPLFERFFSFLPAGRSFLTVTVTSQLTALPLTAYYFNLISVASLVINLLVVPVMGVIVNLGMFVFILTFLWAPLAVPVIYSTGIILKLMLKFLIWAGSLPGVALKVATPSIFLVIASYLSLILLVEADKRGSGFSFLRPVTYVLCVCTFALFLFPPLAHGKLEVTFIDVGQGDAILVQTPRGKRFLIDGGGTNFTGTFNAGENIVVPYLVRRGICRLDAVINTHPDGDHLAGLFPVVEELEVSTVITPPPEHFAESYQEWKSLLDEHDVSWKEGRFGQALLLDEGKVMLEFLHPGDQPVLSERSSDNDNSLVLKLSYGKFSCLLTGDVEADGLEAMVKRGGDFSCTVFKAPHHGSKYAFNQDFYSRANPRIVVFSVGKNNFGHPAPELISFWEEKGAIIYRTDYDGAVTILTDGERVEVKTMGREVVK